MKKRAVSQKRPRTLVCSATKLLVVDLQEALRSSTAALIKSFSERVEVDRSSAKEKTFVLYNSISGYGASMQSVKDANLVEPDALSALDGSELYQRQYRTPDPYWAKTVRRDWDPKPIKWTMKQFFGDVITASPCEEDLELLYVVNSGIDRPRECSLAEEKLKQMGLKARVLEGEDGRTIVVKPAAGSAAEVVAFCQMMLGIEESGTFVFGGDDLVGKCVRGKGNFGFCGAGSSESWDVLEGRVYVSKDVGMGALLDGVLHHAVF